MHRFDNWLDRISEWGNPILVKEVRQALNGPTFLISFVILIFGTWAMTMFLVLRNLESLEFGSIGPDFFLVYAWILGFAALVVVPFTTLRSHIAEREQSTHELVSITTIRPRQIVDGKLWSSASQLILFFSVFAPFLAFTSMLQGLDIFTAVYSATLIAIVAATQCFLCAMVGTFPVGKVTEMFAMLATAVWLLAVYAMVLMLVTQFVAHFPLESDPELWWISAAVLTMVIVGSLFSREIAVARLTFESGNRSTGGRVLLAIGVGLGWLWAFALTFDWSTTGLGSKPGSLTGEWKEIDVIASAISMVAMLLFGIFIVTEQDGISRRVRDRLPRSQLLRLVIAPLLPGGALGFLFTGILLVSILAVASMLLWIFVPTVEMYDNPYITIGTYAAYTVIYLGFANAFSRWLLTVSSTVRPGHVRIHCAAAISATWVFGAILIALLDGTRGAIQTSGAILIPPVAVMQLQREVNTLIYVPILAALAAGAVLVNIRAVFHALRDVIQSPPVTQPRTELPSVESAN